MVFKIRNYNLVQARKIGVTIKPSTRKTKKIDVFKNGKKVASIGAKGYLDYASYKEKFGKTIADKKKDSYQKRHKQNSKIKNTPGYYASKILW
jgi:hypothetical protein